jgi:hypothetical protein
MAQANPKTHKDMSISRVPLILVQRLEQEAQREHLSTSDIIRGVLLRHYGLITEPPNGGEKP